MATNTTVPPEAAKYIWMDGEQVMRDGVYVI